MKFRKIAISFAVILVLAIVIPLLTPRIAIERLFAELGDARAQYNLGVSYLNGDGIAKNPAEAAKWFEKAAGQDYAYANYALGLCDENSHTVFFSRLAAAADQGVAEAQFRIGRAFANHDNRSEAVRWYRKAAEQGLAEAQFNLGRCYYNAFGVTRDFAEAVKWYRKAAEQGNIYAQFNLGVCYISGDGVTEDFAEAAKWYRKAAEQGFAEAQYGLGLFYTLGLGVNRNPVEAAKWYRKAAEQGFVEAQYALGVCYESGIGVTKSRAESEKWYRKAVEQGLSVVQKNSLEVSYALGAGMIIKHWGVGKICEDAEKGNANAQFITGGFYYIGSCLKQDFTQAVKWFREAAEERNINAQFNLGICYAKGQGVPQDFAEAAKWYRRAAKQWQMTEWSHPRVHSNAGAQYCLGICYAGGQGVAMDSAEAVKWFNKAAEERIISARYNLAVCYAGGKGVPQDNSEALKWYRDAIAGRVKLEHDRSVSYFMHEIFIFTEDDIVPVLNKKEISVFAASRTAALKHLQYLLSIPALLFLLYLMYLLPKRRKIRHASKIKLPEETGL